MNRQIYSHRSPSRGTTPSRSVLYAEQDQVLVSDEIAEQLRVAARSLVTVADLRSYMGEFPLSEVRTLVLEALDYFSVPNTLQSGKVDYAVVLPRRSLGFGRRLADTWVLMKYRHGGYQSDYPNLLMALLMWLDRHQTESQQQSMHQSRRFRKASDGATPEAVAQACIRILKTGVMLLE